MADSTDSNPFEPPAATGGPRFQVSDSPDLQRCLPELRAVRNGIKVVYFGIVISVIGVVVAIASGLILAGMAAPMRMADTYGATATLIVLAFCGIGQLCIFIGYWICIRCPEQSGGRRLALISAVCNTLSILLAIGGYCFFFVVLAGMGNLGDAPSELIGALIIGQLGFLAGAILGVIGFFCFLVMLKRLSIFIIRDDLKRSSQSVIRQFGIGIVGYMVLVALVFTLTAIRIPPNMVISLGFALAGLVLVILMIVAVCCYTTLLRNLAKAIEKVIREGFDVPPTPEVRFIRRSDKAAIPEAEIGGADPAEDPNL